MSVTHLNSGLLGHGESIERLETPRPVPALVGIRVRTVAAAEYHSVAVTAGGSALSWGYGGLGRLGHGDEEDVFSPREIALPEEVRARGVAGGDGAVLAAAAGNCHTVLLCASGLACSFGYSGSGRLGLGTRSNDSKQLSPAVISAVADVPLRAVAAGTYHTLLLSTAGVVYSCGEGGLGQLGHGTDRNEASPRPIEALCAIGLLATAVAAGRMHSICAAGDGRVFSWGEGQDGRLGHGDYESSSVPRCVSGLHGVRVCAISSVWEHTLALSDSGRVYSWGLGLCGQLGHGDEEENVIAPKLVEGLQGALIGSVVAGAHHCLAVGVNGCARRSTASHLPANPTPPRHPPPAVVIPQSPMRRSLYGWGVGKTTEEDHVDALGLRLGHNQCRPLQYDGLRLNRPARLTLPA